MPQRILGTLLVAVTASIPLVASSQTIYTVERPGNLVTFDSSGGSRTTIGSMGYSAIHGGLTYDTSTSTMYWADMNKSFGTVNLTTGAFTKIATLSDPYTCLAFAGDGTLYGATYVGGPTDAIYRIDKTTGAATQVGLLNYNGLRYTPLSMVWDSGHSRMVMIGGSLSGQTGTGALDLNLTTGVATLIKANIGVTGSDTPHFTYDGANDMYYTFDFALHYVKYSSDFNVLSTATLTQRIYGAAMKPVPEPATIAAMGLGIAALIRRRRK